MRVNFGGGTFFHKAGGWGFYTSTGFLPAAELLGHKVNLGTKDGGVYEATTVIDFSERYGQLRVEGGRFGMAYTPGDVRPVGPEDVPVTEIARGYINGEGDE